MVSWWTFRNSSQFSLEIFCCGLKKISSTFAEQSRIHAHMAGVCGVEIQAAILTVATYTPLGFIPDYVSLVSLASCNMWKHRVYHR